MGFMDKFVVKSYRKVILICKKVKSLDIPLVSTGDNKLNYTINNMLIGFLSYIADKEREKIQSRVIEGLRNAKSKG